MIRLITVVFVGLAASIAAASPVAHDVANLRLLSANAVVLDVADGRSVYAKAADEVTPIASLTKLMTALVVLDAAQPLDGALAVDMDDFDYVKGSRSRLRLGATLSRDEMLRLALMASENRAASSLARHYPGGLDSFVDAMNAKALALGMTQTRFQDPTGLSPHNVSTANDLARLVRAAAQYPLVRAYSTTPAHFVEVQPGGQMLAFNNSNALVKNDAWDIKLQKTGYIREAGRCVVMLVTIASRPMVIVLLDSFGKYTRMGDAQRVKHWLETGEALPVPAAKPILVKSPPKRVKGSFPAKLASSTKARRG